jgi:hypothetical protein
LRKNKLKVFGREFEGYSPKCGEMSEGQRGTDPIRGALSQKGFSQ